MSNELREALSKHFTKDEVRAIVPIMEAASAYSEGDAFAGMKLENMDGESYESLNEIFQDVGFDVSFNNKMSLAGFVSSPETKDEDLNEALRNL